jgi:hypothetical protein
LYRYVRNWFQAFAFKWVNLYRYVLLTLLSLPLMLVVLVGGCTSSIQLTHSLKAPGFNP